jgi:hypothetical protein
MPPGRLAALLIFATACAEQGVAQPRASLFGRILDASEAGIPEAAVTVIDEDTGFRRSSSSEPGGGYGIGSLEPGVYKITVRKDGFRTVVRFGVRLAGGASARADFVLPVGSVEESVTVVGTAPLIWDDDASAGSQYDRSEMERMPMNGRGVLTLLEMTPGTNVVPATRGEAGQFTSSGQRPNTNYFTVDGVSANTGVSGGGLPVQSTGGALPALSAFGSLDSLVSMDALQEVRVQTSSAVAEYGRLPGAVVALSSRSGSNQFHGSTAWRLRNEALSANDWFANRSGYGRAPLRFNEVAQTVGGPVVRNRTFFFVSYERLAMRQPYAWRQPVPSLDARGEYAPWAQSVLNLFPLPNGRTLAGGVAIWNGQSDRPAGLDAGSARIDHAITPRVTLFGRYRNAPSWNEFGGTEVNRLDLGLQSLTLGLNARPGGNVVLDFRANESQAAAHSRWIVPGGGNGQCALEPLTTVFLGYPAPCDYLVRFSIGGVGQLVSGLEGDRRQRQFQMVESAAVTLGSHTFKAGADYRRITAVRRDATGTLGVIADSIGNLTDTRSVWRATSDAIRRSMDVDELSLWIQDTWRPVGRLAVAAGLRWEYSPAPVPDEPANFLSEPGDYVVAERRPLWPGSDGQLAPRLGLAYRLTADGRTVLRAGGGLYYDSSMSIATDMINSGPLGVSKFNSTMGSLFSYVLSFGFLPDLRLPRVAQWNAAVERAFGAHDALSVGYVGSAARSLLRREVGGQGSGGGAYLALTTNRGASNYDALEVKYRRRVARGLEGMAAYTWSHSIDNDSSDAFLVWAGPGAGAGNDRGSSDFDVRHAATASLSYELPVGANTTGFLRRLGGWGLDGLLYARSGFPITVLQADEFMGLGLMNAFRPNVFPGQPIWIADVSAPGGKRLNPAAFALTWPGQQGALGRNAITGFGMWQVDLALRREFRFSERRRIELRVEAFNAFNHANFADPVRYLNSPIFGEPASMLNLMLGTGSPASGLAPALQTGGPRMLQGLVRFQF